MSFFPTSTPEVIEELQAQNERLQGERSGFENTIAQLTIKIGELEQKNNYLSETIQRHQHSNRVNEAMVDTFMNTLFAYLRDNEIDEAVAEELAGCFGRDLTRTVNVSITIHGEMEVNLPHGMSIDDLAEELDFGPNVHYATGIEVNYVDLSTVEIEEC